MLVLRLKFFVVFSTSFNNTNLKVAGAVDAGLDVSNKVQMTLRVVQSLHNDVARLKQDVAILKNNLSTVINTSSSVSNALPSLLTTKHFQNTLLDVDRQNRHLVCPSSDSNSGLDLLTARDCSEIVSNKSGVYRVKPPQSLSSFFVYCDFETNGGGWTVIHNRPDGTIDFYRGWRDYKHGFGNIGGEHWLGLERIHQLTNYAVNELYVELEDFSFGKKYAHYSAFSVGNEVEGYPISFLGGYDGTAGDSLIYHAGQKFSTHDMDHDNWEEGSCAKSHTGGWWYNGCDTSNLNGKYLSGDLPDQYQFQGMYWQDFRGAQYSLKKAKMMIRPRKDN